MYLRLTHADPKKPDGPILVNPAQFISATPVYYQLEDKENAETYEGAEVVWSEGDVAARAVVRQSTNDIDSYLMQIAVTGITQGFGADWQKMEQKLDEPQT